MSQRMLPTDLELHYRQRLPREEEKKGENFLGMVPRPPEKTADRPLTKLLSE